jgi:hypothetical protein
VYKSTTEFAGKSGAASDFYSECPILESRPLHLMSWGFIDFFRVSEDKYRDGAPKIDHDDFVSHIFNLGTNFLRTVTDLFYFMVGLFNSAVVSLDYIALNDDGMVSG